MYFLTKVFSSSESGMRVQQSMLLEEHITIVKQEVLD